MHGFLSDVNGVNRDSYSIMNSVVLVIASWLQLSLTSIRMDFYG
jgi:hypothetical protein